MSGRNRREGRRRGPSRHLDVGDEVLHHLAHALGVLGKLLRGDQNVPRGGAGFAGTVLHLNDVAGHVRRAPRGLGDVAGDFASRGGLLLHRRGDGGGDLVDRSEEPTYEPQSQRRTSYPVLYW